MGKQIGAWPVQTSGFGCQRRSVPAASRMDEKVPPSVVSVTEMRPFERVCSMVGAYALFELPRLSMWLATTAWISAMPGLDGFLGSKQSGFSAM